MLTLTSLAAALVLHPRLPTVGRSPSRSPPPAMGVQDDLVSDLADLCSSKGCGPILIRLNWHDAGKYSTGALTGGCPNAAMRFTDGKGTLARTPDCPMAVAFADREVRADLNADLWTLAANVRSRRWAVPP